MLEKSFSVVVMAVLVSIVCGEGRYVRLEGMLKALRASKADQNAKLVLFKFAIPCCVSTIPLNNFVLTKHRDLLECRGQAVNVFTAK